MKGGREKGKGYNIEKYSEEKIKDGLKKLIDSDKIRLFFKDEEDKLLEVDAVINDITDDKISVKVDDFYLSASNFNKVFSEGDCLFIDYSGFLYSEEGQKYKIVTFWVFPY